MQLSNPPSLQLKETGLHHIFTSYPEVEENEIRDKVIVGFLCYQGLDSGEIIKPDLGSVNLEIGVIRVNRKKKRAGRTLKLEEGQIQLLTKYLSETRIKILAQVPIFAHVIATNVFSAPGFRHTFLFHRLPAVHWFHCSI